MYTYLYLFITIIRSTVNGIICTTYGGCACTTAICSQHITKFNHTQVSTTVIVLTHHIATPLAPILLNISHHIDNVGNLMLLEYNVSVRVVFAEPTRSLVNVVGGALHRIVLQ